VRIGFACENRKWQARVEAQAREKVGYRAIHGHEMQDRRPAVEVASGFCFAPLGDRRSAMPEPTAFDDIRALFSLMPESSRSAMAAVEQRQRELTKPAGSLGRLEELVSWLAGWQSRDMPTLARPLVAVFAGNHGVLAQGVSAYPAEVTRQMVLNFSSGGAAINQICATFGLGLKVYELALDVPTRDITQEAAMGEREAAGTFAFGMEAIADGPDLLIPGDMGIGNTTIAAAIYHALYGGDAEDWVGRGAGIDDDGWRRKVAAVAAAVAFHGAYLDDPLEVLRRLGGREVAAIAGAILAARLQRIPVILDGYVVCAAAAILQACDPHALDHCLAGHVSAEGAHREVLRRLGKEPLLDLGMRLGEGSGAALAAGLLKAALACHSGMSTFGEAGVTDKT
jgi:nicotinate-nucleotide--dimethylbenzimidazole phosphoribosyltransferase